MPDLDLGPDDYRAKNSDPKAEPVFTPNAHLILAVLFMFGFFGWIASQGAVPILKVVIVRSLEALGLPAPTEPQHSRPTPRQQ